MYRAVISGRRTKSFDTYEQARSYVRKYIRKHFNVAWRGANPPITEFNCSVVKVA